MGAFNPYCLSSYLAYRYVIGEAEAWKPGLAPSLPQVDFDEQIPVVDADQVERALAELVTPDSETGILLSGGIDSAILASYLPAGTRAYTIRFMAEGAIDESQMAQVYAERLGLNLQVVQVGWEDYQRDCDALMRNKSAPLHAIEPALFVAASQAKRDGLSRLVVGNGADSTFGGLDKLLARDWSFDAFVARYTFIDPAAVLEEPVDLRRVFEPFREADGIDAQAFLKSVHGLGIIQAFDNAVGLAGISLVEPYENLRFEGELDLVRIRNGESKYVLRALFERRFHGLEIPEKIAFARPMDRWLEDWSGPKRDEFLRFDIDAFSGDQRWLLWCLERFLDRCEAQD
ncbi:MAG: asparagine synthase [bacterium]|nr:asparagine synthase [bacterium]